MTDELSSLSQRAETRAKARARRAKGIERREAFLDLVASGYSHRQIATAMKVSLATVRREVDKGRAVGGGGERPQARARRHPGVRALHETDLRARPLHGFDGRLGLPRAAPTGNALAAPPPPLALTHTAERPPAAAFGSCTTWRRTR